MEGFPMLVVVLLLYFPGVSGQTASQINHQHVNPGCRSSPNQSYNSLPKCNSTVYLLTAEDSSGFRIDIFNTTRLTQCFRESSSIAIQSALSGILKLLGPGSLDAELVYCQNETCACTIELIGPPESFFRVSYIYRETNRGGLSITFNYVGSPTYLSGNKTSFMTPNNTLRLDMSFSGERLADVSFAVKYSAAPACERRLQVKCSSTMRGIIQTLQWAEGKSYVNNMDSCITLHVPENHVTMISLVSVDLEIYYINNCYDKLWIHNGSNCEGDKIKYICLLKDWKPTVIRDSRVLSFRFTSDWSIVKTGFRLQFSFHTSTEEPLQLPGGKWDCTVPYFDSFRQHFTCSLETFCSDGRDEVGCPENGLCGSNLLTLNGSCYRVFNPESKTSWNKASETCGSYGGNLAVLNRDSELMDVIHQAGKDKIVFIGLRITSSVKLQEMYQNTWLWSDDTLAVYLPIFFDDVRGPHCGALDGGNLTAVNCGKDRIALFLCETNFTPAQAINGSGITLATPSGWNLETMTTCRRFNHMTHSFLACDVKANCSAENQMEITTCSNRFSPPVPFFRCRNEIEQVPYTLVCDFKRDCCDGSDEDFCVFPECNTDTEYECGDTKQCIDRELTCNYYSDCVDGSDELVCQDALPPKELWRNTVQPPARVDFNGFGDFTVTPLPSPTCPESHFQCPGGGYCLPVYVRCNDMYDCPGKEDEMDCDHYTCPGFYRCSDSRICLHEQHLCDDVFQCPQNDDELMCNFTCPEHCRCYGHAFICTGFFTANNYSEIRYIDASNTGMKPEDVLTNNKLIHLSLRNCLISSLGELNFPNLQSLDLSYNNISELDSNLFRRVENLVSLHLAYNVFMSFDSLVAGNLKLMNIINVNFSHVPIQKVEDKLFSTFPHVQYLNISGTRLKKLPEPGFQSLKRLLMIDLRGCPIQVFSPDVFVGLTQLQTLYTDNYKLCCPAVLPGRMDPKRCYAPKHELSSCDALLKTDMYRTFLVLYAILALTGNLGRYVHRVCIHKNAANHAHEVFVIHLSVSNFLMGIYLAIIGVADRVYYGNYHWNEEQWKTNVVCKLAGFLWFVSSEVSAVLIWLITLERCLVIVFPDKNLLRFSQLSAHTSSVLGWIIGLTLALIPLLPMTSHWDFYGQSGLCIPIPVTRTEFEGSDYAFGVLTVMNFVLLLCVAVGQIIMYWSIRFSAVVSTGSEKQRRDAAITGRLLAVVMTDFLCWFPIAVLGLMARGGVPISSEISVATAIFVLPFNSALNPFLCTHYAVLERRNKTSEAKSSGTKTQTVSRHTRTRVSDAVSESRTAERDYSKEEALELFQQLWEDGLLTAEEIRQAIREICEGESSAISSSR